jgi:hypothetical protein
MTKFNLARFSSIFDPDPKAPCPPVPVRTGTKYSGRGEIKENQAPFRVWGKTDFPRNLVKTIFVMYIALIYFFSRSF